MAKLEATKYRGNCGTNFFKAPELLFDMKYDYSIDIWALGCFFEFLLTGSFIFQFDLNPKEKIDQL
jgi:serine/threonine protein kinase